MLLSFLFSLFSLSNYVINFIKNIFNTNNKNNKKHNKNTIKNGYYIYVVFRCNWYNFCYWSWYYIK